MGGAVKTDDVVVLLVVLHGEPFWFEGLAFGSARCELILVQDGRVRSLGRLEEGGYVLGGLDVSRRYLISFMILSELGK